MTGVLTGVRVVELASWTYVPATGVALADWGADATAKDDSAIL
jgi:crotonobetainyl-CoA:carnitine CoA-transferase CaiB-like acyl-CoA transferase